MEYEGQHTANLDATEYNSIGICIAFVGNYETTAPNSTQLNLLTDFIEFYVKKKLIADDYIIVLQDDLKYFATKADALNVEIEKFSNFRPCKYYFQLYNFFDIIKKYILTKYTKYIEERNGTHKDGKVIPTNLTEL